jgi:ribosomal protein S10
MHRCHLVVAAAASVAGRTVRTAAGTTVRRTAAAATAAAAAAGPRRALHIHRPQQMHALPAAAAAVDPARPSSVGPPALPLPPVSGVDDIPHAVAPIDAAAALLAGRSTGPIQPQRRNKKVARARAPKLVSPLLGRIWRGAGTTGRITGTLAPDDWKNVVTLNRQRLLQMKEKEQYSAWRSFQRMKAARIAFLAERHEKPSAEMLQRIAEREASIMKITEKARAQLSAPIPPLPTPQQRNVRNNRGISHSAKALANPQTFLKTAFDTVPWRVFTFRLTHYHSHLLHKQMEKFRELAKKLGLSPSYPTYLPHQVKKFTIIRSPHVDKTSRGQTARRRWGEWNVAVRMVGLCPLTSS